MKQEKVNCIFLNVLERICVFFDFMFVISVKFSYQAHGGKAKAGLENVENGGPGTVFLYHLVHTHRTLLIDNDGGKPLNKHINYAKLDEEGIYRLC